MPKIIRLIMAALIILFPLIMGYLHRSPVLIPILGLIYCPLYILGKAGAWSALRSQGAGRALLKSLPLTFIIQSILAGLFYLAGLGLGALLTDLPIQEGLSSFDFTALTGFTVFMLIGAFMTAFLERRRGPVPVLVDARSRDSGVTIDVQRGDAQKADFKVLPRQITPETFYHSWHFSRQNYTRTALVDKVDYQGNKPARDPKRASEAMIAGAEERLGVTLPQTLRRIYKIQDGGGLPTYYVPKFDGAAPVHDDWITAFAYDYDDLKPLSRLETLYDFHLEYEDPKDSGDWIPGCEKLVVLTMRTGYGTALDYRTGDVPGVLLFDNGRKEPELQKFDSFDAFLATCREIDFDYDSNDAELEDAAYGTPPNPNDPDRFWAQGNPGAGAAQADWSRAGKALGVVLPPELFPFYSASNGGICRFSVTVPAAAPVMGEGEGESSAPVIHPFPEGPYVREPAFLKLETWTSLGELSDRLDFIDSRTPWRDLYIEPEKLIVISGAFDMALLLDFRKNPKLPSVMAMKDLDNPDSGYIYPSVQDFISRLRQFGVPKQEDKTEIGDARISSRRADPESFWMPSSRGHPVAPQVLTDFNEAWGFQASGLPGVIKDIYEVQNGGAVRFRFAPPITLENTRWTQPDMSAKHWNNIFEDGLLPMEDWQPFGAWRARSGLAHEQSIYDFTADIDQYQDGDENVKIRLFVVGDHTSSGPRRLTLLDMSSDFFNRYRDLMTAEYDAKTDRFKIIFGPVMVDNIYHGLFQRVYALKAELD